MTQNLQTTNELISPQEDISSQSMVANFRERSNSTSRQHSLEPTSEIIIHNDSSDTISINRSQSSKNLQSNSSQVLLSFYLSFYLDYLI